MDQIVIREIKNDVNGAIAALQSQQSDEAAIFFTRVLDRVESLKDDRSRRNQFSALTNIFNRCGFPDFELLAAEEAVHLDVLLGLTNLMGQDIIAVGNAHLKMENSTQSEKCYQQALTILLEQGDFASAASANTNLAFVVANQGDNSKAIELLKTSLEYLAKQPFDDTELQTRISLLQLLEFEKWDVKESIENAKLLYLNFFQKMTDQQRNITQDFVGRAAGRYLSENTHIYSADWKKENFPLLYQ